MTSDIPIFGSALATSCISYRNLTRENEPQTQPIESIPLYRMLFHVRENLIQFFHLCLELQSGLFSIQVLPLN
jgi:hypothetical protein